MAWTAQTGLGPRTVALSLKVFIVVMCCAHARLGICTAQRTLPETLQNFLPQMKEHFCSEGNNWSGCQESPGNSGSKTSPKRLCQQIRNCSINCWKTTQDGVPDCKNNQNRICGYNDATVCEYRDGRGTCVYRTDPSLTFCVCQEQYILYTRCMRKDPDPTAQATTTNQPINNETNVEAIVLGSLFALLLLLVIIVAVVLYLRRQGRLPSVLKRTAKPADFSSVQMGARNASRAKLPDLPVPGTSTEYSYAYDHRPAKSGEEYSNQDDHTYYSVGEGGYRVGIHHSVLDGQRPATKELDTSTDDAKDHPYFVLNRNNEGAEVGSEREGGHADKVEVTDSSSGVQSKEVSNEDYTPLVPTGNPKSVKEHFGDEVESPTSANEGDVTSPIELPTEGLSNGDDGTYFPLIQAAAPKSPVEQSGYEDAKIPTSESHEATSPTEAQPTSCDDDTYTPLVRTTESKSQKEHSGYEAAIISNPGFFADSDDTSPYDHLDRKEGSALKEGALSTMEVDDYQHLVDYK